MKAYTGYVKPPTNDGNDEMCRKRRIGRRLDPQGTRSHNTGASIRARDVAMTYNSTATARDYRVSVASCGAAFPAALLTVALLLAACGSSKDQTREPEAADPAESAGTDPAVQMETDGNTAIERIDVNNDQKPDVFKFYRLTETAAAAEKGAEGDKGVMATRKILVRKEMDINFDQRIDIVQFYTGDASKEVMIREEMDLDFDGRTDSTRHYQDGNVTLVEFDLGFDGKTDTWSYFQLTTGDDGKSINRLIERRRDSNGDGAVDVWEYYTKGNLAKIGTDTNGDGTPDQFTRVDEKR